MPMAATMTILVVEDDQAMAELLRALLNDVPGWSATVVHDAAAASAVFRHLRVEVLVVDVNLPGSRASSCSSCCVPIAGGVIRQSS